jgi:hypothetical protein
MLLCADERPGGIARQRLRQGRKIQGLRLGAAAASAAAIAGWVWLLLLLLLRVSLLLMLLLLLLRLLLRVSLLLVVLLLHCPHPHVFVLRGAGQQQLAICGSSRQGWGQECSLAQYSRHR